MAKYSIKEVSERLNISPYTLRFYEKERVISKVGRNSQGVREYDENDVSWLEFVNCFKETGMSLADIKRIVELSSVENSHTTISTRKEILLNHRKNVLEHIAAMQKNLAKVDLKIKHLEALEKEARN